MKFTFLVAVIAVVAMTVAPAIIDGQRRYRWGEDTEVSALRERLARFPVILGDWETTADVPLDRSSRILLQPLESINRVYLNLPNQLRAHVFILLGPTGRTAAHTPDICFNSRAYARQGDRRTVSVDAGRSDSKCFESRFKSRNVDGGLLTSWYAWTNDGTWHASDRPRFEFASDRYLLKIQVAVNYSEAQQEEVDEVTKTLLVEIEKYLKNAVF